MFTNRSDEIHTVIEIIDSSEESDNDETHRQEPSPTLEESTTTSDTIDTTSQMGEASGVSSNGKDAQKKVHNRRKSIHQSIRSVENLSFESVITRGSKADSGNREDNAKDGKKRRWGENNDEADVDDNSNDPEMMRLLKKIAYCRVFTNYLLRQYDMLAIDFKLYSNIDLLMLELKKRVDTYTAIRRSRQRLLLNREIIGNL